MKPACAPEIVVVPPAMYNAPPFSAMFGEASVSVLNVTLAPTVRLDDEYIAPPFVDELPIKEVLERLILPPVSEIAPPETEVLPLKVAPEIAIVPPADDKAPPEESALQLVKVADIVTVPPVEARPPPLSETVHEVNEVPVSVNVPVPAKYIPPPLPEGAEHEENEEFVTDKAPEPSA